MTVDASAHADIITIGTFDGKEKYAHGTFRQPYVTQIYCGDCGGEITDCSDIDKSIREHLEEES